MAPKAMPNAFSVGDRVRIVNTFVISEMRGAVGVVRYVQQVGVIVAYHVELDNNRDEVATLFRGALELVDAAVENPQVMQPLPVALPAEVAGTIRSLTDFAPGVPMTNRLMQEMYDQFRDIGYWVVSPNVPGFHKVSLLLQGSSHKVKKQEVRELVATVACYIGRDGVNGFPENGHTAKYKRFPDTVEGFQQAMEFFKEGVAYLKRRGFCTSCLAETPPRKRVRLDISEKCGLCMFGFGMASV